ncbi:SagB family peptide dehydrogenase [Novosphingobium album (ex Hu et al. 2023)]|uniref:SagB family peptide dehydrogenase n=1 Tax=Novosphingobium album (ex Hu et al. 2023) TaxID=2930093 RepID=A0ABT0B882_9SPHN|nr:SagB family peptide dehydrogenase [Novosphingobium album (ex Hu et al. 2023)]MCJ2181066.1 SagB family peptide dehydrogenase [Novosphingobium album (ex Hu et al. 2023)]
MAEADEPDAVLADERYADLRLTDGIELSVADGNIVLTNGATGARKAFAREDLAVLERFTDWIDPTALIQQALDDAGEEQGSAAAAIDRSIAVFRDLLSIGALSSRRDDLTGERIPSPGAGWEAAMRFLLETRTTDRTRFAVPEEYNAALAVKASLARQASAYLEVVDAPFIALPPPITSSRKGASFPKVLETRRTARRYADEALSEAHLSTLLYYGWGQLRTVPNPLGDVFVRKTSPSGGSLHPVEVYPVVLNVEGVAKGCYHYSVRRHGLEKISTGDPSEWIAAACGDQKWVEEAGVVFLLAAFLPRTAWKYDYSRVARAVMAEIGLSSQSALLTATWLGLGGFTTAALRDETFERQLSLDPLRQPVFSVVGAGALEPEISDHARPRYETALPVEGT